MAGTGVVAFGDNTRYIQPAKKRFGRLRECRSSQPSGKCKPPQSNSIPVIGCTCSKFRRAHADQVVIPEHIGFGICSGLVLKAAGRAIPERLPRPSFDEYVNSACSFILAGILGRPDPWRDRQRAENDENHS